MTSILSINFFFNRKDIFFQILLQLQITDPETMNHLTDFKDKTIDPVTKTNYPWILHLVNRMNAT